MRPLSFDFNENIENIDTSLGVNENFDIIKREMEINSLRVIMYYVDGFVTAALMQKLMMHLTTIKDFGDNSHNSVVEFCKKQVGPQYDANFLDLRTNEEKDEDEKFNLRVGAYVKEYKHNQKIVLAEGQEITAVNCTVILR